MKHMPKLIARLFAALIFSGMFAGTGQASDRIEVIALQNRNAAEIIELIRPLLDKNEAVSGTGYQLIVRATPERQREIGQLVAQLDQAARQVRISVRRASHEEIERERAQANISIGISDNDIEARGRAIVRSTRDRANERNSYQVTALEGNPAYIHTGEEFPVPSTNTRIVNGRVVVDQGIDYKQLSSGFYALARTHGDSVTVDISPQREVLDPRRSGRIQTTSVVTTVRGRLGEWLELGGTTQQRQQQGGGLMRSTRDKDNISQTLWLKVELTDQPEAP